ncbi:uncharacterized protein LOC121732527 [Aricia agestis]|uniref:uncharacterized protein LOC121732527 n=1 Tax=Aricia agestis TaxID=91739 RepID=UPI001C209C48|nr:uncharacterized protein LOC121732527 [Aricia agestis]
MAKAIKTICLEILMYLTIVTMAGHVIAHFFDYYVTRNELSQMKIALNSLKITLNSMGNGYNRLNDEFTEIIKEGSNMQESKQKYKYKTKEHDIKGIKKEFDSILNNIKQKDSVTTIEEYNNLKGEPTLGNISPIRRKTYLKEKHTQSGITSIQRDNILRDRTTSGSIVGIDMSPLY